MDDNKKDLYERYPHLDAVWCVDSERSEEVLIDRNTNRIIARRIDGVIWPVGREGLD